MTGAPAKCAFYLLSRSTRYVAIRAGWLPASGAPFLGEMSDDGWHALRRGGAAESFRAEMPADLWTDLRGEDLLDRRAP